MHSGNLRSAIVVMMAIALAPAEASSAPGPGNVLTYSPLGSEPSCPSYEKVQRQLDDRCPCKAGHSSGDPVKIQISVTRAGHEIVAHSVVTRAGGSEAPRQFTDRTCVAVVEAAVLSACGFSTPDFACAGTATAPPKGAPGNVDALSSTQPEEGPETLPVPDAVGSPAANNQEPARKAAPRRVTWELTLGNATIMRQRQKGGADAQSSGVSIWPALSAGLAGRIDNMSLELSSQLTLATDIHRREDVIFQSGALYLRPCLRWRPFAVCGTLGGGVGRDHAVEPLSESNEIRLTTGARVAADMPIYPWMGLRLHSDADVEWISGARGFRPGGVVGSGISLRLTFNDTLQRLEMLHGK